MYLDDGISRDSAPKLHVMEPAVVSNVAFGTLHKLDGIGDEKAADKYCHVSVHQVSATRQVFGAVHHYSLPTN